jgi:hypothetical protein
VDGHVHPLGSRASERKDCIRIDRFSPPRLVATASVDHVLSHELVRGLRAAATLVEKMRDVDVSGLTDDEHIAIDAVLTTIIQDAIRIRSRLSKPADQ